MADGLTNEAIGRSLGLAVKTVESAVRSVFLKLDLVDDTHSNRRVLAVRQFLNSSPLPADKLPTPRSSLVGRVEELMQLDELIGSRRLVTITGVGGIGKTRLAVELGRRWLDRRTVRFVDLAATDEISARQRVFDAFGLRFTSDRAALRLLGRATASEPSIVIVDNAEHVQSAIRDLIPHLTAAASTTVVVTSRDRLISSGEHVWRAPRLSPDDSLQLLAVRIAEAGNSLSFDPEVLQDWCRELDGMPLAIELAATRFAALAIDQVAHLRLELPTFLQQRTLSRHSSLARVLDETYRELPERSQALARRLAPFRGGFSVDDATFVSTDVVDNDFDLVLFDLVASSLVEFNGARYRMLEPVRQFVAAQLSDAEQYHAEARVVEWCGSFAADAENGFLHDPHRWRPRIAAETDNIDLALDAAVRLGRLPEALHIIRHLCDYWVTGSAASAYARVSGILIKLDGSESPSDRAWGLVAAGRLAACTREHDVALQRLSEALRIFGAQHDADGSTVAGFWLARALGRSDLLEQSVVHAYTTGHPNIEGNACLTLARDQMRRPGRYVETVPLLDRAEIIARSHNLPQLSAYTSLLRAEIMMQANWLGQTNFSVAQIDLLLGHVESFTRISGGTGEHLDYLSIASQNNLHHHRWAAARTSTREQLECAPQTEDPIVVAEAILMAAAVLEHDGHSEDARRVALVAGPVFAEWSSPLWLAFTLYPASSLYPYASARGHGAPTELNDLIALAESTADLLEHDGRIDNHFAHQLVGPPGRARARGSATDSAYGQR
jgi:predicted ATPase